MRPSPHSGVGSVRLPGVLVRNVCVPPLQPSEEIGTQRAEWIGTGIASCAATMGDDEP